MDRRLYRRLSGCCAAVMRSSYLSHNNYNMEIYLIRHTAPAVQHGVCYGQSDIDVADSFEEEAKLVAVYLPSYVQYIITSPLKRCKKLADFLCPSHNIQVSDDLKEIHFGTWELKKWDD